MSAATTRYQRRQCLDWIASAERDDDVKTEGVVHFANAQRIGEMMWQLVDEHHPRVVVIDCAAIPDFEYTALQMLTEAEKKLRRSGIALWLTALNPEPLALIQKSALGHTLGRARMYFNLEEAVKSFKAQASSEGESASRRLHLSPDVLEKSPHG